MAIRVDRRERNLFAWFRKSNAWVWNIQMMVWTQEWKSHTKSFGACYIQCLASVIGFGCARHWSFWCLRASGPHLEVAWKIQNRENQSRSLMAISRQRIALRNNVLAGLSGLDRSLRLQSQMEAPQDCYICYYILQYCIKYLIRQPEQNQDQKIKIKQNIK